MWFIRRHDSETNWDSKAAHWETKNNILHPKTCKQLVTDNTTGYHKIPVEIVLAVAHTGTLHNASRNVQRVETQKQSLLENGITKPLTILLDENGRLLLKDGHHRLTALMQLGYADSVPCTIMETPHIKKNCLTPKECVNVMINHFK